MPEGLGDKPGVCGGSIGQPKWHLDKLVLAERGGEGGLFSVGPVDGNSVEGSSTIEGGEDMASGEAGQIVSNVG